MPTICSAEMFAAISDVPIAHQGKFAAGEEVVLAVLDVPRFLARNPLRERENRYGIDQYDGDIDV